MAFSAHDNPLKNKRSPVLKLDSNKTESPSFIGFRAEGTNIKCSINHHHKIIPSPMAIPTAITIEDLFIRGRFERSEESTSDLFRPEGEKGIRATERSKYFSSEAKNQRVTSSCYLSQVFVNFFQDSILDPNFTYRPQEQERYQHQNNVFYRRRTCYYDLNFLGHLAQARRPDGEQILFLRFVQKKLSISIYAESDRGIF